MSELALICAGAGFALVAYAFWRAHQAEQERRANNGRSVDADHGLELELDNVQRVRAYDERAAANGLYHPDERKVKASHQYPPRPPQS